MDIRLEPKSVISFQTPATEVLYGGAAGGMKSFTLRASAIRWCVEVPGIQVYLFRRTLPDLRDNHLRGPTNFHVMLDAYTRDAHVKYRAVENEFEFWNGSVLHLCYCDSENDVEKYRGAEIHVLLIDELTHFSEYQYRFLRSRVRRAGLTIPEQYRNRLPRIETASNPGSIGHAWVKRTFIAPKPPMEIWRAEADEGGMLRQFIPAKLSENPYLTRDDPAYADRLRGLGADNLVRAMLEGDWDIVAGQAFEKLRRDVHCVEPFTPPDDWLCFGSLDWGSTRPFSFGLWTVPNGNPLPDGRTYRRGSMIRFNEVYGWNGKPNEGLRKEATEVADMIKGRIGMTRIAYIAADPSMWKVDGGPSIAETMLRRGVVLRRADHNRLTGYVEVRQRIAGDGDGPMLFATKNCHDGFWRTMPDIVMDENHPEDVDTEQEDHCFVAGTKVITDRGLLPIEVAHGATVLTTDGFRPCGKVVSRSALCVRLTFDDGSQVECTFDHKFLTLNGWARAGDLLDEVSYNALCASNQLVRLARNLRAFVTGFADTTFRERVFGSIALYGSENTDPSNQENTSTTSTEIARTIISRISRSSMPRRTLAITAVKAISLRGLGPCTKAPDAGTEARKVANGIPSMRAATCLSYWRRKSKSAVQSAISHLWRLRYLRTALCIAAITAKQKRCVSVEPIGRRVVHCLHVFGVHNFALSDGTIVHNCYDDTRYACVSRPWMSAPHRKQEKPDRWLRRFEEDAEAEETWMTV